MLTKCAASDSLGPWLRLLLGLLLAVAATACDPVGNITAEMPAATTSGAYYVDTLTVRAATVWHDSVVTSTTGSLLLGRYADPRLGIVTARSYFRLGLSAAYAPGATVAYDSLVLELKPDAYRYGDTTRQQTVEVHRLLDPLESTRTYYAFSQLRYEAAPLNQGTGTRRFLARPGLRALRLRLADALGRELLGAGQAGRLNTEAELNDRLAGLVLTPGAADDAALLRLPISTNGALLHLYTHERSDPTTALVQDFALASGTKYFYQLTADRAGTLLAPLTNARTGLDVAHTAQEAYIDGALGLETKVEIPYLNDLRSFGAHLTIVHAYLTAEVVPGTGARYLPPPGALNPYLSGPDNRRGLALGSAALPLVTGLSVRTGLEASTYTLSLTDYCQAVVDHTLANGGLLLTGAQSPERVVLGGPRNAAHRMRLALYFIN